MRDSHHHSPEHGSLTTIIAINGRLLYAALGLAFAYAIWPDDIYGYGWGVMSFLVGLSALAMLARAIKDALQLHARDKALAHYLAQGSKPKTAEMASTQALKQAGMSDV